MPSSSTTSALALLSLQKSSRRKVIEKVRPLERSPRMGRMVPEIQDEVIREVLYRNYRIVYVVDRDDEEVEILTIFHSSQQFDALGDE